MTHGSMQAIADALARRTIGSLRFNFPFIEAGRSRTDPPAVATATIADAFQEAQKRTTLPLWLGGHSFGGRMASHAVLDRRLNPAGLIFCSFPLHPPGKPSCTRAAHLSTVPQPMLFLSGTRDELADRVLLDQVVAGLPTAQLDEMARATQNFIERWSI